MAYVHTQRKWIVLIIIIIIIIIIMSVSRLWLSTGGQERKK